MWIRKYNNEGITNIHTGFSIYKSKTNGMYEICFSRMNDCDEYNSVKLAEFGLERIRDFAYDMLLAEIQESGDKILDAQDVRILKDSEKTLCGIPKSEFGYFEPNIASMELTNDETSYVNRMMKAHQNKTKKR